VARYPNFPPRHFAATVDWLAWLAIRSSRATRVRGPPPLASRAMVDILRLHRERRMERETGIEPATNSLEGCDSTTELLPPSRRLTSLPAASARQARLPTALLLTLTCTPTECHAGSAPRTRSKPPLRACDSRSATPHQRRARSALAAKQIAPPTDLALSSCLGLRGWWGGEGSNLRSHMGGRFTVCCD
jgi:hypothetical protein